jgi:hypothetical protein
MSTTATVEEVAENGIRALLKASNLSPSRLIALAREQQQAMWDAKARWEEAVFRGDQAKPMIEGRSGPAYSTDQVAEKLSVSDTTVRNMFERGELVAYPALRGKGLKFPFWQFSTGGRRSTVKPWVKPLLSELDENGWALLDFLTVPRTDLDGISYLAHMERGDEAVCQVLEAAARANPE